MDLYTPNGKYLTDKSQLLSIFPLEIWEKILSNDTLVTEEQVEKISRASLYFHQIFAKNNLLISYLFPKVWPILGRQFHLKYKKDPSFNQLTGNEILNVNYSLRKRYFCQSCIKRIYVRWFSGILNLRLVCRQWCNVIDQFYQQPSKLQLNPRSGKDKVWIQVIIGRKDDKFLSHFRNSHANLERKPMIGREVVLVLEADNRNIDEFCNAYGNHVWYCTIGIPTRYTGKVRCYLAIQEILSKLPNLKSLHVHFGRTRVPGREEHYYFTSMQYIPADSNQDDAERRRVIDERYEAKLCAEIRLNPLPTLAQLESVNITDSTNFLKEKLLTVYGGAAQVQQFQNIDWGIYSNDFEDLSEEAYALLGSDLFELIYDYSFFRHYELFMSTSHF